MCSAHVGSWLIEAGEIDREPRRTRYLVPAARAEKHPRRMPTGEGTMTCNLTRWYPVLLLRNALGRFMVLRIAPEGKPRRRRSPRSGVVAVQVALF